MSKANIIELPGKVTKHKIDTVKVIENVALQTTQKTVAISLRNSMQTDEGLMYGNAFPGNTNLVITDLDLEGKELKPFLELIKKAEKFLRDKKPDPKNPRNEVSYNDLK